MCEIICVYKIYYIYTYIYTIKSHMHIYIHTLIIKSDYTVPGFTWFHMGKYNKMIIILRK